MQLNDSYKIPLHGEFKITFRDKEGNIIKEECDSNLIVTEARNILPVLMNPATSTIGRAFKVGVIELGWGGHEIVSGIPQTIIPNITDTDVYKNFMSPPYSKPYRITFAVGDTRTPAERGIVDPTDNSVREVIVNLHEVTDLNGNTNRITYTTKIMDYDTEINGLYISEAGMFTSHFVAGDPDPYKSDAVNRYMFAHKCFGGFLKTSDYRVDIEWTIIF